MMAPTLMEALEIVQRAAEGDPALRSMIAARLGLKDPSVPSYGPRPIGLPPLCELTALQVTLFDNGSKPVAAQIEVWTERGYAKPNQSGYSKLGAVRLYSAKDFRMKLRKLRNRASQVSEDWQHVMNGFLDGFGGNYLFGPVIQTKPGHGAVYLEGQMVIAEVVGGHVAQVALFNGAVTVNARAFTRLSSMGRPLASNALGSARLDFAGDNDDWATETGLVIP